MSGKTSSAHAVRGTVIRESRTLCTHRSVSAKELKSSSSAMLSLSLNILEMRVGRRGLVLDCCWVGFAGLVGGSFSRCLRPKRAVLLISLRRQQGFVRPFMSGCRPACCSGRRRAERWCPNFRVSNERKVTYQWNARATARSVCCLPALTMRGSSWSPPGRGLLCSAGLECSGR